MTRMSPLRRRMIEDMTVPPHGNGPTAPRLLGVSRPRRRCPQLRNTRILASISMAGILPASRIDGILQRDNCTCVIQHPSPDLARNGQLTPRA
jgi:hypothetical protein